MDSHKGSRMIADTLLALALFVIVGSCVVGIEWLISSAK